MFTTVPETANHHTHSPVNCCSSYEFITRFGITTRVKFKSHGRRTNAAIVENQFIFYKNGLRERLSYKKYFIEESSAKIQRCGKNAARKGERQRFNRGGEHCGVDV